MRLPSLTLLLALIFASVQPVCGIIFLGTGDPQHNTSTPGDNSGWQYEGQFGVFLGTPIAPQFFITARHIGGGVGQSFIFHGKTYTTTESHPDPTTDLHIFKVDGTFADYAPLYQSGTETGHEVHVFGRGTQRGVEQTLGGRLRGWDWGTFDSVQRWGRNIVADTVLSQGASYLQADFDSPGLPDEAHLSAGDSTGGVFVIEDGLWKLAAVNYAVDDLYTAPANSADVVWAIFDARGYYQKDDAGNFFQIPDRGTNVPTSFYSTRIAPRLGWIESVISQTTAALPPEDYPRWQTLYFTPDQIADVAAAGSTADGDGDGVPNLLEFAFNLDPTYAEPATMIPGTGLRGLPLVLLEATGDGTSRLTVEFVRRTAESDPGITYAVQWTDRLAPESADWQPGGTETVTPINARWERVKVTDSAAAGQRRLTRFARVAVSLAAPLKPGSSLR